MIICKKNNIYYFFLQNPKCGSSLLQYIVLNSCSKYIIHCGHKRISQCDNNSNNINYNHCGIKGVIDYIHKYNINRKNTIIICSIRNPYKRVISNYYWNLKLTNKKYIISQNIDDDICFFLEQKGLRQSQKPNNFRKYLNHKVDFIIKLENISDDIEKFNKKYDLNLKYNNKIVNKNKYNRNIILNSYVKNKIYNDYKIDFIDGNYLK